MIAAAIVAAFVAVAVALFQKTRNRKRMPWETSETHRRLGGKDEAGE